MKRFRLKSANKEGSRRDQAPTSSCPLPKGSCGQSLLLPMTMCDNTHRVPATVQAHPSLGVGAVIGAWSCRHGWPPAWLNLVPSLSRYQADTVWPKPPTRHRTVCIDDPMSPQVRKSIKTLLDVTSQASSTSQKFLWSRLTLY